MRPQISILSTNVSEDAGAATVKIVLSHEAQGPIQVDLETVDAWGSATAGADYQPTQGRVVFQPGEQEKTFEISLVNDNRVESVERFAVRMSAEGAVSAVMSPGQDHATVTITDDDIASSTTAGAEGESGAQPESDLGADLDQDGQITVRDALFAIDSFRQMVLLDIEPVKELDINQDGKVRSDDILAVIHAVREANQARWGGSAEEAPMHSSDREEVFSQFQATRPLAKSIVEPLASDPLRSRSALAE